MVNLKYLVSKLQATIESSTSNTIKECMFLSNADIKFFKANNCLISLNSTSVKGRYDVELDRKHLLALCH